MAPLLQEIHALAWYGDFMRENTAKLLLPFEETVVRNGLQLPRNRVTTVQVNLGKLCNQACHHCHVEAGPKRTEVMTLQSMERIIALLRTTGDIRTVDLTGGAPELNPHFRWFVRELRGLGLHVMDRCNLTVLLEQGQEDTAEFLAQQQVEITASLPCYSQKNVEQQRGKGVFDKSIAALRMLNQLGYGKPGSALTLNLVYNPGGPFLPPAQAKLEADYRRELGALFGIEFTGLFTITNMPIKRFLHELERDGKLEAYMHLLVTSFNPQAASGVMCRDLVSVGWDGELYDCDFNQMLELPLGGSRKTLWDIASFQDIEPQPIAFDSHCYGCTAGAGSSCGGALSQT
jgi:radical SAM/Cys-rich protein